MYTCCAFWQVSLRWLCSGLVNTVKFDNSYFVWFVNLLASRCDACFLGHEILTAMIPRGLLCYLFNISMKTYVSFATQIWKKYYSIWLGQICPKISIYFCALLYNPMYASEKYVTFITVSPFVYFTLRWMLCNYATFIHVSLRSFCSHWLSNAMYDSHATQHWYNCNSTIYAALGLTLRCLPSIYLTLSGCLTAIDLCYELKCPRLYTTCQNIKLSFRSSILALSLHAFVVCRLKLKESILHHFSTIILYSWSYKTINIMIILLKKVFSKISI